MAVIRCRARVSSKCYGVAGRDEAGVYPDGDQREDGTYSRASNTVVCDACYIAVGGPTLEHLESAVRTAQQRLGVEPI